METPTVSHSVTKITQDATLDNLSLTDYQDMVQDLRTTLSLEKLILVLNSQYSKPLWAKVEKGESAPNRNQRNELRRYYGMPPLPPTVAEATAAASPDAAVWQVGEGVPINVIMVTTQEPMTLHVNGAVSVVGTEPQSQQNANVTAVTRTKPPEPYRTRPTATEAQNRRRAALGVKWAQIIERGLAALEQEVR
jgi:hypothetical protein